MNQPEGSRQGLQTALGAEGTLWGVLQKHEREGTVPGRPPSPEPQESTGYEESQNVETEVEVWVRTRWSGVTEAQGLAGDRHSCATLFRNQKAETYKPYQIPTPRP